MKHCLKIPDALPREVVNHKRNPGIIDSIHPGGCIVNISRNSAETDDQHADDDPEFHLLSDAVEQEQCSDDQEHDI